MRVQDEEALKIILESYLEENALFMLKTDRQTFLSRILSLSEDEVVVSSPVEDYPLPEMTVEMHFHDEWGWYSFTSAVTSPPDFDKPRLSLSRPVSAERFLHRKYTRVAVDLEARCGPLDGKHLSMVKVCDLSVGGALIQTDEQLDFEQKLQIQLSLPGQELPAIVAVPCREMLQTEDATPPFYTGCEFVGLSHDAMTIIRDYVWQQLKAGLP